MANDTKYKMPMKNDAVIGCMEYGIFINIENEINTSCMIKGTTLCQVAFFAPLKQRRYVHSR